MNNDELKSIIPLEKVYQDAISPAMQQIGKSLESLAKTSRFLLAPFSYLAAQHDRWERRLKKIAEKVDDQNLTDGHPQLVIPTLEGLSLCSENSLLGELFINLLANSIDKTKQDFAHPAFPIIIKNLSRDEAVLLFYLKKKTYEIIQRTEYDNKKQIWYNHRKIYEEFPIEKLHFPNHILIYMNHLNSLNLAGTFEFGEPEYFNDSTGTLSYMTEKKVRRIEEFGKLFVDACVPDEFEGL